MQIQTSWSVSKTTEKGAAHLPPDPSVAVFRGMLAAVAEHQGGGQQKRRKRCYLVFLIALLQGHWVVLEEQGQNTLNEMNREFEIRSLIQVSSLAKCSVFFPVFHRFTSESVRPGLKLIYLHISYLTLKYFGGVSHLPRSITQISCFRRRWPILGIKPSTTRCFPAASSLTLHTCTEDLLHLDKIHT